MFFGLNFPFCAADALWGGVMHTFGQISKPVGSVLWADRALQGGLESRALKPPN